ncbi:MAG: DHHA1 domain-containing protein [Patescibacteria group bacterium]|nr:DHHA1 domain-containing protein [Patescibacteria group bacterium]
MSKDIDVSPIIAEKAPIILEEIKRANRILLHCHPSPDPDSVGSALAMKFALEGMGKKVTVIKGDSEIPLAFKHFPGADSIVNKNFFEIDLSDFDLFISLDSASQQMISRKGDIHFPLQIRSINIDHHVSNTLYGDITLVDHSSPALAFVLYQLFLVWNIEINHDIAINMFMGMYTDTGGFKYEGVDYRFLKCATELVKVAPDFKKALFILENSNSKDAIYFNAVALDCIGTYLNDNVVISAIPNKRLVEKGIDPVVASGSGIENQLKSVIGWNISALMIEIEPNKIKISFRTRDSERFDVSKLAASIGGGGHKAAAGAILNTSLEEAEKLVLSKIKELFNL